MVDSGVAISHQGGCACGDIRYRLSQPLRDLANCHCASCRRYSGGAYVPWGTVDTAGFHLERGTLATIDSSPGVQRGFCDRCGCSLTYSNTGRPDDIDIALVTLDESSRIAPVMHIWVEDKLPWVGIADDLPQYPTVSGPR